MHVGTTFINNQGDLIDVRITASSTNETGRIMTVSVNDENHDTPLDPQEFVLALDMAMGTTRDPVTLDSPGLDVYVNLSGAFDAQASINRRLGNIYGTVVDEVGCDYDTFHTYNYA